MGKIIYQVWISLDGYAADDSRSTSFFEDRKYSVDSDDDLLASMKGIDTIILGAETYKMFAGYWPMQTSGDEPMADFINATRKIVFSRSLTEAHWGKYPALEINNTDAVKAIQSMKDKDSKNIVLWGSISLAQSLFAAGLIDEWDIRIVPITLGSGLPLFGDHPANLQLTECKKYASGLALLKYKKK